MYAYAVREAVKEVRWHSRGCLFTVEYFGEPVSISS